MNRYEIRYTDQAAPNTTFMVVMLGDNEAELTQRMNDLGYEVVLLRFMGVRNDSI